MGVGSFQSCKLKFRAQMHLQIAYSLICLINQCAFRMEIMNCIKNRKGSVGQGKWLFPKNWPIFIQIANKIKKQVE